MFSAREATKTSVTESGDASGGGGEAQGGQREAIVLGRVRSNSSRRAAGGLVMERSWGRVGGAGGIGWKGGWWLGGDELGQFEIGRPAGQDRA